jgi:hypothetical protein
MAPFSTSLVDDRSAADAVPAKTKTIKEAVMARGMAAVRFLVRATLLFLPQYEQCRTGSESSIILKHALPSYRAGSLSVEILP